MVGTTSDWEDELGRWLEPFLERASSNKMVQLIIVTRRKTLCHWLNALAITQSDQPRHVKWTHSLS